MQFCYIIILTLLITLYMHEILQIWRQLLNSQAAYMMQLVEVIKILLADFSRQP